MQVNIKFDTEKESVDDLKRLITSLQELVAQREKMGAAKPMQSFVSQPQPQVQAPVQQAPKPSDGHTSGGGRIMEYDPSVADLLSKFASGSKY